MTAEVVPLPGAAQFPVRQGITPRHPLRRGADGTLAVLVEGRLVTTPLAEAEGPTRAPANRRPGPLTPEPSRITNALDDRDMSGRWVDEALGVLDADGNDTAVDAWEAGTVVPSESEVRRLATLTQMPVAWFYRGPLPSIDGFLCVCPR